MMQKSRERFEEYLACEILKFYDEKKYAELQVVDKPDLQNDFYGIEVSNIIDEEDQQVHREFSNLANFYQNLEKKLVGINTEIEKEKIIKREKAYFEKRYNIIKSKGYSIFLNCALINPKKISFYDIFEKIYTKKLSDLIRDDLYAKKHYYELFLINRLSKLTQTELNFIEKEIASKPFNFNTIYVEDNAKLYIFKVCNNAVTSEFVDLGTYHEFRLIKIAHDKYLTAKGVTNE